MRGYLFNIISEEEILHNTIRNHLLFWKSNNKEKGVFSKKFFLIKLANNDIFRVLFFIFNKDETFILGIFNPGLIESLKYDFISLLIALRNPSLCGNE